jgi:hypothetical protein
MRGTRFATGITIMALAGSLLAAGCGDAGVSGGPGDAPPADGVPLDGRAGIEDLRPDLVADVFGETGGETVLPDALTDAPFPDFDAHLAGEPRLRALSPAFAVGTSTGGGWTLTARAVADAPSAPAGGSTWRLHSMTTGGAP